MRTGSEKTTTTTSTTAKQATQEPFFGKQGGGGFFEGTKPSKTPVIHTKLTINQPGDIYEQEADKMADQVVQRLATPGHENEEPLTPTNHQTPTAIQPKCEACEKEEEIQRKEEEGLEQQQEIQRQAESASPSEPGGEAGSDFTSRLNASKGGGSPLPENTRADMESAFGSDFSGVRIHTGGEAAGMNRVINAQAFTHGSDIYFNEGKFDEGSTEGKRLLAHELVHVGQQGNIIRRAETDTKVNTGNILDSKDDINNHVNNILGEARTRFRNEEMIKYVYDRLGGTVSPARSAIENWVTDDLDNSKKYQPKVDETKYSGVEDNVSVFGRGKIWTQSLFPILNPSIKVNGVLIGSDKLGHFFQQGFEYFIKAYVEKKGVSAAEKYGHDTEAGGYGLDTTGVFSNSDLVANKKGMNFYLDLFANTNMVFDISSYIDKNWNETFNPNFYAQVVGEMVWKNLIQRATSGYMTDINFDSILLVAIKPNLQVNGSELKGTLIYDNPKKGKGNIEIDIEGVIKFYNKEDIDAIYGLNIDLKWTSSGGKSGTGTLKSYGESKIAGMLFEKKEGKTIDFFECRILL